MFEHGIILEYIALLRGLEMYRYIVLAYRETIHNKVFEGLQEHQFLGVSPDEATKMKLNSGLRERMIL